MKQETVSRILKEIETGYDSIANKFSETRKHFWHEFEFIGDYTKNEDKILDYGCGNGRLLELMKNKNVKYIGIDISRKLIDIARRKYGDDNAEFQKISSLESLPFPNNFFNVIYSIAVFHHLPSLKLRKKTVRELYRIIKPKGYIIITVWNLWRIKYMKDIFKNYIDKLTYKSDFDWNDCVVPFKDDQNRIFNRYHHAFTKKELKKLFTGAGFEIIDCAIIDSKNIILIAKK